MKSAKLLKGIAVRQIVWSARARADAASIFDFIAERNAPAADRMKALIVDKVQQLVDFPYIHRIGRVADTREAVIHPNYIIIYRVGEQSIRILKVLHARQQYPGVIG